MFTEYEWTITTTVRDRKYRDANKVFTLRKSSLKLEVLETKEQ